jgi:hypothetical protein
MRPAQAKLPFLAMPNKFSRNRLPDLLQFTDYGRLLTAQSSPQPALSPTPAPYLCRAFYCVMEP